MLAPLHCLNTVGHGEVCRPLSLNLVGTNPLVVYPPEYALARVVSTRICGRLST